MDEEPLFIFGHERIGSTDIAQKVRETGAQDGDTLFVHSDLTAFGKLAPGVNRDTLCRAIIDALEMAVPQGTIVMPTFTYAFCKSGLYDIDMSKSEVGLLTEYFRKLPKTLRSPHPIFSVAASGTYAKTLTDVDMDSFGKNSIFGKIHERNALILFLGASFERATYAHYIEQMHGIPYRFVKTFNGTTRRAAQITDVSCTCLVRYLDRNVETYLEPLRGNLQSAHALKSVQIGGAQILGARARDMFDVGMKMLDMNIYSFLAQPPSSAKGVAQTR